MNLSSVYFKSCEIHIQGLVQGVGFRPFVYRLAHRFGLTGQVCNADDGVVIRVEGPPEAHESFLSELKAHPPNASRIYSIDIRPCTAEHFNDFQIVKSRSSSTRITQVSPDIAVCSDCLDDMKSQPHRLGYPFINCTHCGPRFTIIRELPYDRPATTMEPFEMCGQCRSEYEAPGDRRFHAQPVACNECGPEYTLIRFPDKGWPGSSEDSAGQRKGKKEYAEQRDVIQDYSEYGNTVTGIRSILEACIGLIKQGGIIAVKGMGGFHLMCDAENLQAVQKLRNAKMRDGKPFAVMARNPESAARFAEISPLEEELLSSWRRPVVLLRHKSKLTAAPDTKLTSGEASREASKLTSREASREASKQSFGEASREASKLTSKQTTGADEHTVRISPDINPGCSTMGVMLPYMPFHHLLFEKIPDAVLVMTSGNLSDEPIVIHNGEAVRTFQDMADATVTYNRDIHNRTDDSVVFAANNKPRIIRRSRGFVPEPVLLPWQTEGIFAAGAELNHCFAVGKGREAMLSQHIGDLKDPATHLFFEESVSRFCSLFRVKPAAAVCDMHPDYLSTRYAQGLGLPVTEVQHHHAHIAACMAEYHLDEPVLGVCWDGTGLGTDGNIWGGEFLHADLLGFERFAHFNYLPLPGGDKAAKQIWRTGLSLLYQTFGEDFHELDLPFVRKTREKPEWNMIHQAVVRQVNAPLSSAAGRLFDAVAAITGICRHNSYHAEAPMKLEALTVPDVRDGYPFEWDKDSSFGWNKVHPIEGSQKSAMEKKQDRDAAAPASAAQSHSIRSMEFGNEIHRHSKAASTARSVGFRPMIHAITEDLMSGTPLPVISTRFHNTLVSVTEAVLLEMQRLYGTKKVVLTGGVFQNRYLLENTEQRLEARFEVYSPSAIPANDAGIALGQMAVAARKGVI